MGYTVKDWIGLHELTVTAILDILGFAEAFDMPAKISCRHGRHGLPDTPNAAQDLIFHSMDWFFSRENPSTYLSSKVTWFFEPFGLPDHAPLTLHGGKSAETEIHCAYQKTGPDLISLAHEYGHALQLTISDLEFILPIDREIAAFLSEHILIAYLEFKSSKVHSLLQQVWHDENKIYFGEDMQKLRMALGCKNAAYYYYQNYPIARVIAYRLFQERSADQIWPIFKGNSGLQMFREHKDSIAAVA